MENIDFRLASTADLALLLDYMQQFYALDNYAFDAQLARRAMKTLLEDAALGRVWLICQDGEAVGYVALTFGYSLEFRGRDSFVDELFLLPTYRNRGIGTRTLAFVFEQCSQLGIKAVHLEVEDGNEAGKALYHKTGFELHAHRAIMSKWIDKS